MLKTEDISLQRQDNKLDAKHKIDFFPSRVQIQTPLAELRPSGWLNKLNISALLLEGLQIL
jgi:hypothetical protein